MKRQSHTWVGWAIMVPSEWPSLCSGHQFLLQTVRKGCSQTPLPFQMPSDAVIYLLCSVQGPKIRSQPERRLFQATG